MGVVGAFLYLDQKGISGESVELKDVDEKIQVDVLSLLRVHIESTRKSILLSVLMQNARDNRHADVSQECSNRLSSCLSYKLKQLGFRPAQSVLHFDGLPSLQKTKARVKRASIDAEEVNNVRSFIRKTTQAVRSLPAPPMTVNRARKERVLRAAKSAMRLYKTAKVMDKGYIAELVEAMLSEWDVHVCHGEADVCISCSQGHVAVATTDSDLLFHGVHTIFRQDPHDRLKFLRYKTADVLQKLSLTTAMWTVAAVVSNNDYSEHVPQCGLLTNVNIIKSISGARFMDKRQLLKSYCMEVSRSHEVPGLNPQRFSHAASIFFSRREDFVDQPQDANGLDQEIAEMIEAVEDFKCNYNEQRQGSVRSPAQHRGPLGSLTRNFQSMEIDEDQPKIESASGQQQRPHLAYMSSNQFKITTYTMPDIMHVDGASSSTSRTKRKKKQKRKAKTLYNPSSRRARLAQVETGAETASGGRTRTLKPATIIDQVLTKEFATVSLDCGTLAAQVTAAIKQNEIGDEEDRPSLAKTIVSVIQEMVYVGNEAMRCAQQAFACYFAEVITLYGTLSPYDVGKRKEKFGQFSSFRNNTFFTNLLQDIFRWYDDEDQSRRGRPRKETEANASIKEILGANSADRRVLSKAKKTVPNLKRHLTGGLTHFFEQCGVHLADQFQCHFLRNTAELIQRLKVENPAWVSGEGKAVIATINIKQGTSSKHDQLSLFWILNSHLPSSRQMAFLPESGFTDKFMHITELHLIEAVYANVDFKKVFRKTKTAAEDHLANHPGDLTYRWFFSNKLQYRKNSVLMAPDRDVEATASIPLFDLHGRDLKAYENSVKALQGSKHVDARKKFKELLQSHIEDAQTYKAMLDDGSSTKKYVLTGTIVTNGHELQVLAYGLTKTKPPSTPPPNTTRAKLNDARQIFAPDQSIEDILPHTDYVIVGIDPGICSTATATVIDTRTPGRLKNITVSQGAQTHCTKAFMKGLQKAKEKATFDVQFPDEVEASPRNIEQLESTIVPIGCSIEVGKDLGPSWRQLGESLLDHVHSLLLVQEYLRSFYTSRMFKIKSYHRKTATKATRNKAVDRIISASGLREKWDDNKGPRPVFAVGDGQFGSSKGPLLHQQFVAHLKKRAEALNMIVVYVDEFRTSKICCRCDSVCKEQGRSLKCSGCRFERDRDHNAATNMARAVLMLIEKGVWPAVLCRDYDLESGTFLSTLSATDGVAA